MKKILLSAISAFSFFLINAQSPTFQWAKMSPYQIKATAVDASGHYYTTGYFNNTIDFDPGAGVSNLTSNSGSNDICISKYDGTGNLVWAKNMGGTEHDYGQSSVVDGSGNVYTVGYFASSADFDPNAGVFLLNSSSSSDLDIFITKLNSSGNLVWAKKLGGVGEDKAYSIALDASGNVFTTGYFSETADFDPSIGIYNLTATDSTDIFISKLDAAGNFLWAKKIGGTEGDLAKTISIDGSGNVYAFGKFQATVDFDPGAGVTNLTASSSCGWCYDNFILKLDGAGNYLWAKKGYSDGNSYDNPRLNNTIDASGNIYCTGVFGNLKDFDLGPGVFNMHDNNGAIFIVKLNSSGIFLWAKQFGSSTTYTFSGGSGSDFTALDSYAITLDLLGNIYTTGRFKKTADYDPGAGVFVLAPLVGADTIYDSRVFVSKLDASGNFKWATAYGGTGFEKGFFINVDVFNNIFTGGEFCSGADFDPGPSIYNVPSPSGCGFSYIHKMSQTTTGLLEKGQEILIKTFPNPAQNEITVKLENNTLSKISIIDLLGKEIIQLQATELFNKINVSDLQEGIYFLTVNQNGNLFTEKIVIGR